MSKRLVLASFALLCFAWGGVWTYAQEDVQSSSRNLASRVQNPADIYEQSFDIVWRTVKEKHFDPGIGGVDWDLARKTYEPKVAAVKSDLQFYLLLQEMLGLLHQSHFNIIPPESIIPENEEPKKGGVGIDLRLKGSIAMITRVEPNSSASIAGLRPGFLIKRVDDKTIEEIIAKYTKSAERPEIKHIRMTNGVLAAISGEPGDRVRIVYTDAKDQEKEISLERQKLTGALSPSFGNLPPLYTEFETRRIASGGEAYIGYIRFNVFSSPVIEKIKAAIREFSDAEGLIFDLRGNPGGIGGIAMTIASRICSMQGSLGVMKTRNSEVKFVFFPQENSYSGPVAVLQDEMSASTSEVFSAGVQEMGRAIIVGERSAGAALPSYLQKLPTGALFQFAIADFKTPKGVLIEGRGVSPDVEAPYDRASLLAGHDPQLDAAVEQIHKSREKPSRKW